MVLIIHERLLHPSFSLGLCNILKHFFFFPLLLSLQAGEAILRLCHLQGTINDLIVWRLSSLFITWALCAVLRRKLVMRFPPSRKDSSTFSGSVVTPPWSDDEQPKRTSRTNDTRKDELRLKNS